MIRAVLGASALTLVTISLHGCFTAQPPPAPPPPLLVRSEEFLHAQSPEENRRCAAYLKGAAPRGISAYAVSTLSRANGQLFENLTLSPDWPDLNKRFLCEVATGFKKVAFRSPLLAVSHGSSYEQTLQDLTREGDLLRRSWSYTPYFGFYNNDTARCHFYVKDNRFCLSGGRHRDDTEMLAFISKFKDIFNHTFMDALDNKCGRALIARCQIAWRHVPGLYTDNNQYGGPRTARWKLSTHYRRMDSAIQPSSFDDEATHAPGALSEVGGHACGSDVSASPSLEDLLANLSSQLSPVHLEDKLAPVREAAAALANASKGHDQSHENEAFYGKLKLGVLVANVVKDVGPTLISLVATAFAPGADILFLLVLSISTTTGDARLEEPEQDKDWGALVSNAVEQVFEKNTKSEIKRDFQDLQIRITVILRMLKYSPTVATWRRKVKPLSDMFKKTANNALQLMEIIIDNGMKLRGSDVDMLQEESHLMLFHVSKMLRVLLVQYLQIKQVYFAFGSQILLAEGKTRCRDSLELCQLHLLSPSNTLFDSCSQALTKCDTEFFEVAHDLRDEVEVHIRQWAGLRGQGGSKGLTGLKGVIDVLQHLALHPKELDAIDQLGVLQEFEAMFTEVSLLSVHPASKAKPRHPRALLTLSCLQGPDKSYQHMTVLNTGGRSRAPRNNLRSVTGEIVGTAPDRRISERDLPLRTFWAMRDASANMRYSVDNGYIESYESWEVSLKVRLAVMDNYESLTPVWNHSSPMGLPGDFHYAPSVEGGFFVAYHKTHDVTEIQKFCRSSKSGYVFCARADISDTVLFLVPRTSGGLFVVTLNTIWKFTPDLDYMKNPYMHGDIHYAAPDATGGLWVSMRMHWKHTHGWTSLFYFDDDLHAKVELGGWFGIRRFIPIAGGGVLAWVSKGLGSFQLNKIDREGWVAAHSDSNHWNELETMVPVSDGSFVIRTRTGAVWHVKSDLTSEPLLTSSFQRTNKLLEHCSGTTVAALSPLDWHEATPNSAGMANLLPWTP